MIEILIEDKNSSKTLAPTEIIEVHPRYIEHPDRIKTFLIYNLLNMFVGSFVSSFTPIAKALVSVY